MILSVIFIESCQSRDTDGKTLKSVCLSKKRTKIVEKGKEGEGGGLRSPGQKLARFYTAGREIMRSCQSVADKITIWGCNFGREKWPPHTENTRTSVRATTREVLRWGGAGEKFINTQFRTN